MRARRGPLPQEHRILPPSPSEPVLRLTLGPEAAGMRLDRALADRLPQHSRTAVASWIAAGLVQVQGRVVPARTRVRGGEAVEIAVPARRPATIQPEPIPLQVVHADEHLVVVDKPAGLVVHPGSGRRGGTLANALVHHLGALPEAGGADRPGIVHRLDRGTSGLLVVARTDPVQRALSRAFARREVQKTYLACVHGVPRDASGTIDLPLDRSARDRTKRAVRHGGRPALTHWEVVRRWTANALLRVRPVTGRTHQIRVHLKAIAHPLVGDRTYAPRRGAEEPPGARLMLHAARLAFVHPVTGEPVAYEAPLPPDFEEVLARLP